jgi:hypothetical protein
MLQVLTLSAALSTLAGFEALSALPRDDRGSVSIEAVVVADDLLEALKAWREHRELVSATDGGRAYYDDAVYAHALGFDLHRQLKTIAKLASPQGNTVAGALAIMRNRSREGPRYLWQVLFRAGPGFEQRLESAHQQQPPPSWTVQKSRVGYAFESSEHKFFGRLDAKGWFRVGPEPGMLFDGSPLGWLSESLAKQISHLSAVLLLPGEGVFFRALVKGSKGEVTRGVLRSIETVALGWKKDIERSSRIEVYLESRALGEYVRMVRAPETSNRFVPLWKPDALTFFSASMPPLLLGAAAPLIGAILGKGPHTVPEEVIDLLSELDGRLGYAHYGSPGDWVAAAAFRETEAARSVVPKLHRWLSSSDTQQIGPNYLLENHEGSAESFLHLRPDPALQGSRLGRVGETIVWTPQRARFNKLLLPDTELQQLDADAQVSFANAFVTEPMKRFLSEPAMMLYYTVLGSDGSTFEDLGLLFSLTDGWIKKALASSTADLGELSAALYRLPLTMAVAAYSAQMTYDLAWSLDIEGRSLVLRIASSNL